MRRAAKDTLSLQAEVARVTALLSQAGVDARKRSTMVSLRTEVGRLSADLKASQAEKEALASRVEVLEAELATLRASKATLSKSLFGRKSEQQDKTRSGRRRGQQRDAARHGRTQRPALAEKSEEHHPAHDARLCACCGKPYVANGAHESKMVEVHVEAHTRVIRRPRWRRSCTCASSPREVSAPPAARLFANTSYGVSVWARFLFERYACLRPLNRVAAWLCDQGLAVSAGTLGDSVRRFVALFEPLAEAILAHQNEARLRHGDETGWRIQSLGEQGRSSRAWLWVALGNGAVSFHVDPTRSAKAAAKLFGDAAPETILVCDRYCAYKKLARDLGGLVVLAWCWAHQRRDFIACAAGHEALAQWGQEWIERIASIYRLNDARLVHYERGLDPQTQAFAAAQHELEREVERLFADAERELASLPAGAREGKALRSLVNHREGLSVFVARAWVPMDNNAAERALRGAAIGRRLSFGSNSETGARFTAVMYSIVGTLARLPQLAAKTRITR